MYVTLRTAFALAFLTLASLRGSAVGHLSLVGTTIQTRIMSARARDPWGGALVSGAMRRLDRAQIRVGVGGPHRHGRRVRLPVPRMSAGALRD